MLIIIVEEKCTSIPIFKVSRGGGAGGSVHLTSSSVNASISLSADGGENAAGGGGDFVEANLCQANSTVMPMLNVSGGNGRVTLAQIMS